MAKIIENFVLLNSMNQTQDFGEIFKAKHLITNEFVTVKVIKIERFVQDNRVREMILQEIQTIKKLQKLDHIIKIHKMLKSNNHIYIVYEHCEDGTLEQYLQKKKINATEAFNLFHQIVKAYQNLIDEEIIHTNINLSSMYLKNGNIKFADFGLCRLYNSSHPLQLTPEVIEQLQFRTSKGLAPEVIQFKKPEVKSDMFSLGVALSEIMSFTGIASTSYTSQINQILKGLQEGDINKRFSYQQLLQQFEEPKGFTNLDFNSDVLKKVDTKSKDEIKKPTIQTYNRDLSEKIVEVTQQIMKERQKIVYMLKVVQDIVQMNVDSHQSELTSFMIIKYALYYNFRLQKCLDEGQQYQYFEQIFENDEYLLQKYKQNNEAIILKQYLWKEGEELQEQIRLFSNKSDSEKMNDDFKQNLPIFQKILENYNEFLLKAIEKNPNLKKKNTFHMIDIITILNIDDFFTSYIEKNTNIQSFHNQLEFFPLDQLFNQLQYKNIIKIYQNLQIHNL